MARLSQVMEESFPEVAFRVPVDPMARDVFEASATKPSRSEPRASARPAPAAAPEQRPAERDLPTGVPWLAGGSALSSQRAATAASFVSPHGDDAFERAFEHGAAVRSAERVRQFEENVGENRWYDYHLLENFWRVKDDENALDMRNDDERAVDERRDIDTVDGSRADRDQDEREIAERLNLEQSRERQMDALRDDHERMARETEERIRRDMADERRDYERAEEYRDAMRRNDD